MNTTARNYGKRMLSSALALAMLVSLCATGASADEVIGNGVHATYDEAYYALTDYYGNLTEGSVVKSYVVNGQTALTDYGRYDEVVNLTDGSAPASEDGATVFRFADGKAPSHFYFEGKTAAPFAALPWKLAVHYTLNGVPTDAAELAGRTGVVEICFDAVPNEAASEYAKNNYTLEAMAVFNQDDILSLEAPGAQVQLIGNLRAVLFVVLPGEEQHFSIRVGTEDFSFGGMTFLMVPATLSQLQEIAKLSERKDDLEENYRKLSGSLDTLLDSMSGISGSLYETAEGLDELNGARDTVSTGKDALYAQGDTVLGDIDALTESLSTLPGHLDGAAAAVDETTEALDSVSTALHELQTQLHTTKKDLNYLEAYLDNVRKDSLYTADSLKDLGKLADNVNVDTEQLLAALAELNVQIGGGDITVQGMTAAQIENALKQAESLKLLFSSVASGGSMTQEQFLLSAMIANGTSAQEAQAQLTQVGQITAAIEGAIAQGMPQSAAAAAVYAQLGLTTEQIAVYEASAAKLATLKQLYGSFAPSGSMDEKTFFAAMLMASGNAATPAEASAQAQKLFKLCDSMQSMTSRVENLCGMFGYYDGITGDLSRLMNDVSGLLNEIKNISKTADDMVDTLDTTLDAAEKMHDIVNQYAPGLKTTLTETKDTVTVLTTTLSDTTGFLTSFESLMKNAGKQADSGAKKTLEGLADALRATAKSLNTTGDVKAAKRSISGIIEDTWNEYTGDVNNLLLMDATAEAQSLTDPRNPAPTSVQVLIRTQEIKTAEPTAEELAVKEAPQTTFFGRIAQMFRDLWAAVTGIFH